jgi:hypothetical protein
MSVYLLFNLRYGHCPFGAFLTAAKGAGGSENCQYGINHTYNINISRSAMTEVNNKPQYSRELVSRQILIKEG